jgi:hypothetical protein
MIIYTRILELGSHMTLYSYANKQLTRISNSIKKSSQIVILDSQAHLVQYDEDITRLISIHEIPYNY